MDWHARAGRSLGWLLGLRPPVSQPARSFARVESATYIVRVPIRLVSEYACTYGVGRDGNCALFATTGASVRASTEIRHGPRCVYWSAPCLSLRRIEESRAGELVLRADTSESRASLSAFLLLIRFQWVYPADRSRVILACEKRQR